jgi:hypothetical protein
MQVEEFWWFVLSVGVVVVTGLTRAEVFVCGFGKREVEFRAESLGINVTDALSVNS